MNKKIISLILIIFFLTLHADAAIPATSLEIRGEVYDGQATGHVPYTGSSVGWDAYNFAGFWYDLKDGKMSEKMTMTGTASASLNYGGRTIEKDNLFYNSTMQIIQYKVNEANATNNFVDRGLLADGTKASALQHAGYYGKLGWFGEPYVALNGKPNKLAKLIIEQGTSSTEKKTLTVGETWDIGDGWNLTVQGIHPSATPKNARIILSKNGVQKDNRTINQSQVYTYVETTIANESNVPLFVTYADNISTGNSSDILQLRYTWAVSTDVTEVRPSDT
jgi:S-layer protein (TIGR01567 family)